VRMSPPGAAVSTLRPPSRSGPLSPLVATRTLLSPFIFGHRPWERRNKGRLRHKQFHITGSVAGGSEVSHARRKCPINHREIRWIKCFSFPTWPYVNN
jgi:hypothetical protein